MKADRDRDRESVHLLIGDTAAADGSSGDESGKMAAGPPSAFTGNLAIAVSVAVLASLQFGWNLGVPNNLELVIRGADCGAGAGDGDDDRVLAWLPVCLPMSDDVWGFVMAVFSLGGLVGGLTGGWLCRRFGRLATILANNALFIVGALFMALAFDVWMMALGRFIIGIGCGVATSAVPMYIGEVAPVGLRGALGVVPQICIVSSILVAQILGLFFHGAVGWRVLFGVPVVIAALQIVVVPLTVESPHYLVARRQLDRALAGLQWIRADYSPASQQELDRLVRESEEDSASGAGSSASMLDLFRDAYLRKALAIAIVAQLAQQFSGVNGVILYSTSTFQVFLGDTAKYVTVGIAALNLLMTVVAAALIERAGRRPLILSSGFGLAATSLVIVVSSVARWNVGIALGVILFISMFALGLGPIPWLITSELFPTYAIATASSLSVMVNWTGSFVISYLFPVLANLLGDYTFLPFAVVSAVAALWLFFKLPETKGKSIDSIIRLVQS